MVVKITHSYLEEKQEECGIVAIYSKKGTDVAPLLYRALISLQHRGQDAAGFAVFNDGKINVRKGLGLVSAIFKPKDLEAKGSLGIGHTRYPTAGRITKAEVQPFVNEPIAIAHNGHVANYKLIKNEIEKMHKLKSTSDSEVLSELLRENLGDGLESALTKLMNTVDGAYSNVAIVRGELVAFRDPHAIRPLVYGENDDYICFASESTALDINNINYAGDVGPGELMTIKDNKIAKKTIKKLESRHCMFEYVYFARPDSIINGTDVFEVRKRLGVELAKEQPVNADVVIAIPDTARTAAAAFSKQTSIPIEEGLIKNRYIGRTFIMPSQDKRKSAVGLKLNPIRSIIEGKRVVLIDDSIVRGTTLREIVSLVRNAGALEVHLRITCPPLKAPCFYGVNMATYKELIASNKSVEEIRKFLGVDTLGYISIGGLKKAINLPICTGCLNEDYITEYAKRLAMEKRDSEAYCG